MKRRVFYREMIEISTLPRSFWLLTWLHSRALSCALSRVTAFLGLFCIRVCLSDLGRKNRKSEKKKSYLLACFWFLAQRRRRASCIPLFFFSSQLCWLGFRCRLKRGLSASLHLISFFRSGWRGGKRIVRSRPV